MKIKMLILSGVLAASLSVSGIAWAGEEPSAGDRISEVLGALFEEGGVMDELLGEDTSLEDLIPSGEELDELISSAKEKLEEVKDEVREAVLTLITDEDGNFDAEKAEELLSSAKALIGVAESTESAVEDMAAESVEPAVEEMAAESVESAVEDMAVESWAEDAADTSDEISEVIDALFGEEGLVNGLLSEDSSLRDLIPDGEQLDELVSRVEEKLGEADIDVEKAVEGIFSYFRDGNGEFDLERAKAMGSYFLSMLMGDEDFMPGSEGLSAKTMAVWEAMKAYILKENAEYMDFGDEQLVMLLPVWDTTLDRNEEVRELIICEQQNFTLEGTELHLLSSATDTMLYTLAPDEDGTYTVTDAQHAEDGEGYRASIEAMCGEVGASVEQYDMMEEYHPLYVPGQLAEYLEEHPEITGIEYQGEILSLDELRAVRDEMTKELYGEPEVSIAEEAEA